MTKVRAYHWLRITVGTIVLVGTLAAFTDVGDRLGESLVHAFFWPQFLPSAMAFMRGAGWAALGFAAVLLLTLLFGRVYCAMLCPLGVLMDFSAWLAGKRSHKRKLPWTRGVPWLRAAVVVLGVGAVVFTGSMAAFGMLDPFSLFGRVTTNLLRPAVGWATNRAAIAGWVDPVKISPAPLGAVLTSAGLLVLIVGLAVKRGRLWCNTMCPVGAVLGAISKFSLFRLYLEKSECVSCSLCERTCPAQCIDHKNHRIDHSRCVMCLKCVPNCRKEGLGLKMMWGKRHSATSVPEAFDLPPSPVVSRRVFFGGIAVLAANAEGTGSGGGRGHGRGYGRGLGRGLGRGRHGEGGCESPRRPVLPPGARSLAHFQSTCTACHLCVAQCPEQVLRPSVTRFGLAGFLQPYQDFGVAFCDYSCNACSQVCPTGAIQPITVEERQGIQSGIAHFRRGKCIVKTDGTSCGACSEHCPTQAVHMVPWGDDLTIPEVTPELCVGCGACEHVCPAQPEKAIVIDGLPVHAAAERIKLDGENTVREMEEEFPF
jgi:polyferredoxin